MSARRKIRQQLTDHTRPYCRPLTLMVMRTIFADFCTDILSRIFLPVSRILIKQTGHLANSSQIVMQKYWRISYFYIQSKD
jgi:hypothetical protein